MSVFCILIPKKKKKKLVLVLSTSREIHQNRGSPNFQSYGSWDALQRLKRSVHLLNFCSVIFRTKFRIYKVQFYCNIPIVKSFYNAAPFLCFTLK